MIVTDTNPTFDEGARVADWSGHCGTVIGETETISGLFVRAAWDAGYETAHNPKYLLLAGDDRGEADGQGEG